MVTPSEWDDVPRPSLTRSIALLCAVAVTVSIAAVSVLAWVTTRSVLRDQVDAALEPPRTRLDGAGGATTPGFGRGQLRPELSAPGPLLATTDVEQLCAAVSDAFERFRAGPVSLQLVRADGTTCTPGGADLVPVRTADRRATAGGPTTQRDDETEAGVPVRVRSQHLAEGFAVLIVRDLSEIDTTLRWLAVVLGVSTLLGGGLALTAGVVVARTALRPVERLTRAAEHVSRTHELRTRIPVTGEDEVARLSHAFNAMTASLEESRDRQSRLVADAGHELRTPLTSLRTNIELLERSEARGRPLEPEHRAAVLARVVAQLGELATLTEELTELARTTEAAPADDVRLDEVVQAAADRVGLRADHGLVVDVEPWLVTGDAAQLERAVVNLADNAVKFSTSGTTVRITLRAKGSGWATVVVDDEGPGVPPADRSLVFERFWRADDARARPGSGLGLAIVAEAAARHGGTVATEPAPGGGARFVIRLPGRRP
ncbi:MAG: sensor histidine kinase [Dermatophilaceae bacterium]